MEKHHFENPHIIAAYNDERFVGIFITHPAETVSTEYLIELFSDVSPTCFVVEEIPELDDEHTIEIYAQLLDCMIAEFTESKFSELSRDNLLYIPRTLH